MAAAAIIGGGAALIGTGVNIWSAVNNYNDGQKQASFNEEQLKIAQEQINIAKENSEISRQNFELQTKNSHLNALNQVDAYKREISDLQGKMGEYNLSIKEAENQIANYDSWLENYQGQYEQEVASKQAHIESLKASGKESYDNFMNAIGYNDAVAGATGRVGANTSQAKMAGMLDRNLVDYVGEDRRLDEAGGLYGAQMTAANMEMEQLKIDLEAQRAEVQGNRNVLWEAIGTEENPGLYRQGLARTKQNIMEADAEWAKLQKFILENFPTGHSFDAAIDAQGGGPLAYTPPAVRTAGLTGESVLIEDNWSAPESQWLYAGRKNDLYQPPTPPALTPASLKTAGLEINPDEDEEIIKSGLLGAIKVAAKVASKT
jgi:hypothetical protein